MALRAVLAVRQDQVWVMLNTRAVVVVMEGIPQGMQAEEVVAQPGHVEPGKTAALLQSTTEHRAVVAPVVD